VPARRWPCALRLAGGVFHVHVSLSFLCENINRNRSLMCQNPYLAQHERGLIYRERESLTTEEATNPIASHKASMPRPSRSLEGRGVGGLPGAPQREKAAAGSLL
jgi:hypothetical protein